MLSKQKPLSYDASFKVRWWCGVRYQPHVACFVQILIASHSTCRLKILHFSSVLLHCRQRVDGMSVTRWTGVSTYMSVLNFGCFFSLKVMGSTYMRIALSINRSTQNLQGAAAQHVQEPQQQSVVSTTKKYTLESSSECILVSLMS